MKILLDTHTFLWWSIHPDRLPNRLTEILSAPETDVYFSVASSWESQIKMGIGKLVLKESIQTIIQKEMENNHWIILPIHLSHTWQLQFLPPLHKDPFDRILIAQAISEDLIIATKDPFILSYSEAKTIWD